MPNLENLRKQAKQILRRHKDGYHPVATQIRTLLPSFSGLSDREILDHPFRLSDAQELVARRSGFESWQALEEGLETMPTQQQTTTSQPVLIAAEPQLFVKDISASCDYYTKVLGFAVAFSYGDPAFYAQVKRDGAALNLRVVHEAAIDSEIAAKEQLLSASITLGSPGDVKQLFAEFEASGAGFLQTLKREPWGAKAFIVRDPDGNLILFAGPAD